MECPLNGSKKYCGFTLPCEKCPFGLNPSRRDSKEQKYYKDCYFCYKHPYTYPDE